MNKKKYSLAGIALLLTACSWLSSAVVVQAGTEEIGLSIEPELSFDWGDYGGGDTITTTSFSLTAEYDLSDAWTLSLTIVPYLHQDETYTDVVLVAGRPVHHVDRSGFNPHHRNTHFHDGHENEQPGHHPVIHGTEKDRASFGGSDRDIHGREDHTAEAAQQRNSTATSRPSAAVDQVETVMEEQEVIRHGSATGIGDTTVDLSWRVVEEGERIPEISLHGGLKLPTADEDKGLGTGKVDALVGVDLSKELENWSLDAGITYNILGEPDEYELNNYLSAYGEIANSVTDNVEIALQLSGAGAASDESDGELALGLQLRYDMEELGEFSAGIEKGLADGSPDYYMVIGYSISF
ncbi:MAG: hypothetical protein DSY57_03990 [Desulfobulbus sp.]|nr:MAG: hypothetical protein DSY57_03990 [Desulfobulbus sp.]